MQFKHNGGTRCPTNTPQWHSLKGTSRKFPLELPLIIASFGIRVVHLEWWCSSRLTASAAADPSTTTVKSVSFFSTIHPILILLGAWLSPPCRVHFPSTSPDLALIQFRGWQILTKLKGTRPEKWQELQSTKLGDYSQFIIDPLHITITIIRSNGSIYIT